MSRQHEDHLVVSRAQILLPKFTFPSGLAILED